MIQITKKPLNPDIILCLRATSRSDTLNRATNRSMFLQTVKKRDTQATLNPVSGENPVESRNRVGNEKPVGGENPVDNPNRVGNKIPVGNEIPVENENPVED